MAIRIFLDTEFTGLHKNTTIISLGLAAETGEVFYAEFDDFDKYQVDEWVRNNVLVHLTGNFTNAEKAHTKPEMFVSGSMVDVSRALRRWIKLFGTEKNSVEIWADVLAWDWVLFCDVFGGAFGLPDQIHYIPRDLSTLLAAKGIDPDTERETLGRVVWAHKKVTLSRHNALYDALLEKDIFNNINKL